VTPWPSASWALSIATRSRYAAREAAGSGCAVGNAIVIGFNVRPDVKARERAQRFVGRSLEVLIEGPSRTDATRLRGRSRHNKVVNFAGLGSSGDMVEVEITSATSQTLAGTESLLARAAH